MTIDVTDDPRPRLRDAQLRRPARDLDRYGDGGRVCTFWNCSWHGY